jgi:hypothetical protein
MCGDEQIRSASDIFFTADKAKQDITNAYRVVSGLNGPVPQGAALNAAIDLMELTRAVGALQGTGAGSPPPIMAGGRGNPSYADMGVAVLRAFAHDEAALEDLTDKVLVLNYADQVVYLQNAAGAHEVLEIVSNARGLESAVRADTINRAQGVVSAKTSGENADRSKAYSAPELHVP